MQPSLQHGKCYHTVGKGLHGNVNIGVHHFGSASSLDNISALSAKFHSWEYNSSTGNCQISLPGLSCALFCRGDVWSSLPPGLLLLGGPAQDLPKFQIPSLTPKSVQTCSIHSPDGDSKVSLKNDLFMTNGCPLVAPPEVTSDWLMTDSWLAVSRLLIHVLCPFAHL